MFRKLEKSDLHEIISVAKSSYDIVSFEKYVLEDILSAFDKNQRYKIELYGYFSNGKLVHFGGFVKNIGISYSYTLRLATTLPEFRGMGYNTRSLDKRMAIICERHPNDPIIIQVATKKTKAYDKHGFVKSGHESIGGYIHLYKLIKQRKAL